MDDEKLIEQIAALLRGNTLLAEAIIKKVRAAEAQREDDLDYAARYPDEARKMEDRAHRAGTIAAEREQATEIRKTHDEFLAACGVSNLGELASQRDALREALEEIASKHDEPATVLDIVEAALAKGGEGEA